MIRTMRVRFISHAGISIETEKARIAIDPWFYSSTLDHPLIQSILPGHQTIDFQVPPGRLNIRDLEPDAVLVSHFHAHHSPESEIRDFASRGRKLLLGGPVISADQQLSLFENLGQSSSNVEYRAFPENGPLELGDLTIEGFEHTSKHHVGWKIKGNSGSVLHITDAMINRNSIDRRLDPLWSALKDSNPDFLFIGSGGHCTRRVRDGVVRLFEDSTLSPFEAARLAALIRPRAVAVIGFYNHSMWKNRLEYVLPASVVEDQFQWAMHQLLPEASVVALRPGNEFEISKKSSTGRTEIEMKL
jgi:hypothetical protein